MQSRSNPLYVMFVTDRKNGGVRGLPQKQQPHKLTVIAKSYKVPGNVMPEHREWWQCRLMRDTNPENPSKGTRFVEPLRKVQPETEYYLLGTKDSDGAYSLLVQRRSFDGENMYDFAEWTCRSTGDVIDFWPKAVRTHAKDMLKDQVERERSCTPDSTRQRISVAPRRKLANPSPIRVTAVLRETNKRRILLSTGDVVEITAQQSSRSMPRGDLGVLQWTVAKTLRQGDVIAHEYPFQWSGDNLTNGRVFLSRECPAREFFARLGIKPIPSKYWDLFLASLEGKFCANIVEHADEEERKREAAAPKPRPQLTERQRQLAAVVNGQMWKGDEHVDAVTVGNCVVFHARTNSGLRLYLVDNPGVGAIFLFPEEESANKFASGAMSRTEAREKGYPRIEHREGWEGFVTRILAK